VLKVGDIVKVKILSVEPEKNRIALTMKFWFVLSIYLWVKKNFYTKNIIKRLRNC
jgi:hypothetical protein